MMMAIKRTMNRFGYDIKRYHSFYGNILKRFDIKTILDIGANTGQFAGEIFKHFPSIKIYSFEPLPDCYASLVKNMSHAGEYFQAFNVALGEEEAKLWINKNSFSPSSSLLNASHILKKSYPKSAASSKEMVRVQKLDTMALKLQMDDNIMVKMDVQGYEDKVIRGGTATISRAKVLLIETSFVQLYENQPLFDDIYQAIRKLGFSYYGNNGAHYDKKTDELLFEDSIFIKQELLRQR